MPPKPIAAKRKRKLVPITGTKENPIVIAAKRKRKLVPITGTKENPIVLGTHTRLKRKPAKPPTGARRKPGRVVIPPLRLDKVRPRPDTDQQDRADVDKFYWAEASTDRQVRTVALQLARSGVAVKYLLFLYPNEDEPDESQLRAESYIGQFKYRLNRAKQKVVHPEYEIESIDSNDDEEVGQWFTDEISDWFESEAPFMVWFINLKNKWEPNSHSVCALFDRKAMTFEYLDSNSETPKGDWFDELENAARSRYATSSGTQLLKTKMTQTLHQTGTKVGVCQAYTMSFVYLRVMGGYSFEEAVDYLSAGHCRLGFSRPVLTAIRGGFQMHYTTKTKRRRRRRIERTK